MQDTPEAAEPIRRYHPVPPSRSKYTTEFKLGLVRESLRPGSSVNKLARQNDVNANMLFRWRKEYREGILHDRPPAEGDPRFIDIGVVNKAGGITMLVPAKATGGSDAGKSADHAEQKASGDAQKPPPGGSSRPRGSGGRMEIHLNNGITVRVTIPVDDSELKRVLAVAAAVPGERR